ncbi:MAG: nucleotidyl transferase AbiEii/AbiGii toxin family protein [Actinomycetales bacterium]|nr:nucleotidyl transferase AbiEii/AbiGii toxin family protein [Actinomycetales bacterium]
MSLEDTVSNKISALFTRTEVRDFIDVDAIRSSAPFTDEAIMSSATERDAGFSIKQFASQLELIQRITADRFAEYGIDAEQCATIKTRFLDWAAALRGA